MSCLYNNDRNLGSQQPVSLTAKPAVHPASPADLSGAAGWKADWRENRAGLQMIRALSL